MEPVVEGVLTTADAYWRVEVVRHGRASTWYRVWYATTMVTDRASLATVERILGEDFPTLAPLEDQGGTAVS